MGQLFSEKQVIRLYDLQGNEIGMTVGCAKEIAYAMSKSQRIEKAISFSPLFGEEVTLRSSLSQKALAKVADNKKLGENLLFWVGKPIVINN